MAAITMRPRTPEDDERIVEIRAAINTDGPTSNVAELRQTIAMQPPRAELEVEVAELDGEVAGIAQWNRQVYVEGDDIWWAMIWVDPSAQHRGVGTALYNQFTGAVLPKAPDKVYCTVREGDAHTETFVRHRGFVPSGKANRRSRLDVAEARLERCREAFERMPRYGIRIATLAELGEHDENVLRTLHKLDIETSRDVPSAEEFTEIPYDEWVKYFDYPGMSADAVWIALDKDQPVGWAILERRGERYADNAYTGVDREYRGKGIARALKFRTVKWAREHGIEAVFTGNELTNQPMLAINMEMGYQPLPASVEYVKEFRG